MSKPEATDPPDRVRTRLGEWAVVSGAMLLLLAMGLTNIGRPSLWHDELVHYHVAKGIKETGRPVLPSGQLYPTYVAYNALLAGWMTVVGDGDGAARSLSVMIGCINIACLFVFSRRFLGVGAATLACYALATSPWFLAWAREARFYVFQQMLYLIFLGLMWKVLMHPTNRATIVRGIAACATYVVAVLTSYHSILFAGPIGAYSFINGSVSKPFRKSNWVIFALSAVTGFATLAVFKILLGQVDTEAVFTHAGLGNQAYDPQRADFWYYFRWLHLNLSTGYFIAAMAGFVLIGLREGKRGWYWVLAFWVPILILNFFIGYRRPRFMFFLFPMYVGAFSYAIVQSLRFMRHWRKSWTHATVCAVLLLFGARLALSTQRLVADSMALAAGADLTLAKLHPTWRESCRRVQEQLAPDDAVLASSFLPVYHYVGRVDQWYPSRFLPGEVQESGMLGLRTLDDLKAWLIRHPQGYYIADTWQFDRMKSWPRFAEEYRWVDEHMDLLANASTETVSVRRWTPETLARP